MMKNLILLCVTMIHPFLAHSQYSAIKKGDQIVSGSVGFINPEAFAFNLFGVAGGGNPSPSFTAHYEYSITNRFAIGAYASYYRVNANFSNSVEDVLNSLGTGNIDQVLTDIGCVLLGNCGEATVEERINVFTFGGKGSFHKNLFEGVDTYASVYLGYSLSRRKTITENLLELVSEEVGLGVSVPSIVYYTSIGARFFPKEKIGIFGELGYGNSHIANIGVTYLINGEGRNGATN